MKNKAMVTILSVALNLVLLAALVRVTSRNNDYGNSIPAIIFKIQQLPEAMPSKN